MVVIAALSSTGHDLFESFDIVFSLILDEAAQREGAVRLPFSCVSFFSVSPLPAFAFPRASKNENLRAGDSVHRHPSPEGQRVHPSPSSRLRKQSLPASLLGVGVRRGTADEQRQGTQAGKIKTKPGRPATENSWISHICFSFRRGICV